MLNCRQANGQPRIVVSIASDTVDICGSDKRSLITVNVGTLYAKDSILGYDLELSYNPKKIKVLQELVIGTLTENTIMHTSNLSVSGKIAANSINDVTLFKSSYTNQPLIQFIAEVQGKCEDTAEIVINYVSLSHLQSDGNVTDIAPDTTFNGYIVAQIAKTSDRWISLGVNIDSVLYDVSNREFQIDVALKNAKGKNLTSCVLSCGIVDTNSFSITKIVSNNSNVVIDSFQVSNSQLYCRILRDSLLATRFLTFSVLSKSNISTKSKLILRPVQVNQCACINTFLESSVELIENGINDIHEVNDRSESTFGQECQCTVYNVLGLIVTQFDTYIGLQYYSFLQDVPIGCYFIVASAKNGSVKTKKIQKIQ